MTISVLGIIPARGGSKGVINKNIALLNNQPLISYTLRAAKNSRRLSSFLVTTDSTAIAECCRTHDVKVPWLRPSELATDDSRVQDSVRHALDNWLEVPNPDYIMLLQPTAPLRVSTDIDNAIDLAERYKANSVVSFTLEQSRHPYYMYYIERSKVPGISDEVRPLVEYSPGTPRQEFPNVAYRNGAIYLVKTSVFLDKDIFLTPDVTPYLMDAERSVNIDTAHDLELAEYLLKVKVVV